MKYNGIELTEMLPENWDGKPRKMLVWCNDTTHTTPMKRVVCGYDPIHLGWLVAETQAVWHHCAEIPHVEAQQSEIKNLEKSNSKLHCYLLHALSEVFLLKYEQTFDFELVGTNDGPWKMKRYMHRKDMLFRKYLAYRDAYKKAKTKLKD